MHFWYIFQNPEISFVIKWTGVDQVLTKILQIDPKLTFNVFHILNHVRISKIEKNIWWYRPPPKKRPFFGGSVDLKAKDFGYVSGRYKYTIFYISIFTILYSKKGVLRQSPRKHFLSLQILLPFKKSNNSRRGNLKGMPQMNRSFTFIYNTKQIIKFCKNSDFSFFFSKKKSHAYTAIKYSWKYFLKARRFF